MNYAVVTGSTSGIGLAIVEALLNDNCYVFLNYSTNKKRADEVRMLLAKHNGRFDFIRADLSDYSGIENLTATIRDHGVLIKYLVLNFGMTDRTAFGDITSENWERVMRANITIPFFMIQRLCNDELFSNNASILCISSLMASVPHAISPSYGISKSALSALPGNLAKYLSPKDIRINAVEPGFVDTQWQKDKPSTQISRIQAKITMSRIR